jgi:hypothetical protein
MASLRLMLYVLLREATVARRLRQYGLKGSGKTTREMPEVDRRQLVVDQMSKDPKAQRGPRLVKEGIAFDTGIHLTRYASLYLPCVRLVH